MNNVYDSNKVSFDKNEQVIYDGIPLEITMQEASDCVAITGLSISKIIMSQYAQKLVEWRDKRIDGLI
jgi:hypothetical protein